MQNYEETLKELQSVISKSDKLLRTRLKKENLKKRRAFYLILVFLNKGITMQDLALLMQVDKGTITKVVKALIEARVIKKTQDDKDKRVWRLYPLEGMDEFYLELNAKYNEICKLIFANYSNKELDFLRNYVNRVLNNIKSLRSA